MGYFEQRERSTDESFLDLMHDNGMDERFGPIDFEWGVAVDRRAREIIAELNSGVYAEPSPLTTFDPYAARAEPTREIGQVAVEDELAIHVQIPLSVAEEVVEAIMHYEDHVCEHSASRLWEWLIGEIGPTIAYGLQLEVGDSILDEDD